jgi:serine/threonine protein kinase
VALKVLAAGLGLTPRAVERFHREAEAAAKLHHSNIVLVYATGAQDGTHFYAMELVEGPSLDRVLDRLRRPSDTPAPELLATGALPARRRGFELGRPDRVLVEFRGGLLRQRGEDGR